MAKNLLLALLFGGLQFSSIPIFSSTELRATQNVQNDVEACNLPAPDSLKVSSRGPNFITVIWKPAVATNTYTITVLTRTDTSEWVQFGVFQNIPGSSYTINDVAFDLECKVIIATNCVNGEPSNLTKSCTDKIILELTTGGRKPVNPQPISCTNIHYNNWEWVGFSVFQDGTYTSSNLFEINVIGDKVKIRRVYDPTVVYATLDDNSFPGLPKYPPNPFKLIKKIPSGIIESVGRLSVTKTGNTLDICQSNSIPAWNNSFSFTMMKSDAVFSLEPAPAFGCSDRLALNSGIQLENIKVQSPFKDALNIFLDQTNQAEANILIRLLDINNQIVLEKQIQAPFERVYIPVETILTGIYVLRIETREGIRVLRIIKSE